MEEPRFRALLYECAGKIAEDHGLGDWDDSDFEIHVRPVPAYLRSSLGANLVGLILVERITPGHWFFVPHESTIEMIFAEDLAAGIFGDVWARREP